MSLDITAYLDPSTKPYPFCPGCSHSIVLDRVGEALAKTGLPPDKVVLVSDIGCIGISDRHFKVHTFHGLHGRSITYATGLKLANPALTVFVLVGDGGIGIGGHHFLHAARRNVDITVLVCNNFNFGMTGGQHSVTTPHGAVTATTAMGNAENPIDIVGLAAAAQASFGVRCLFSDPGLPDYIAQAIMTPGFAVLDIWEMCTAYFAKTNKVTKNALHEQLEKRGLKTGVVLGSLQEARPPSPAQPMADVTAGAIRESGADAALQGLRRDTPGAPAPGVGGAGGGAGVGRGAGLQVEFESKLERRLTLLVAGRAGQKVRSGAITLGKAAVMSGLFVTQRDDYPVTVQTGHSTAELVFERGPIDALGVDVPDEVLVTAVEGRDVSAAMLKALPPTSVVYAVPEVFPIDTCARVETIPVEALGVAKNRTALVLACLAWWAVRTGRVPIEALMRAAALGSKKAVAEENVAVIDAVGKWAGAHP